MFAAMPRIFSNKENALPACSSSSSFPRSPSRPSPSSTKPRVGGIGPSPRRREHGGKPYARPPGAHAAAQRSTSVQRAKRAALSPSPSPAPSSRDAKGRRRPPPINTSITAAAPVVQAQPKRAARIPLRIPMPVFPPIADVEVGASIIPAKYVAAKLAPHLYNLLVVSALFRPYPSIPAPSSPTPLGDSSAPNSPPRSRPQSVAFAIPQVVDGSDAKLGQRAQGLEPDICLAFSQRGKPELGCRLMPATDIVYASKCAYWPGVPALAAPAGVTADSRSSTLSVIPEEEDIKPDLAALSSPPATPRSASSSWSSASPSASPPTSPTSAAVVDGPYHHLPVVALDLPSASTFQYLHAHLHTPARPFAPALLGLDRAAPADATREQLTAGLQARTTPELMAILERIHGVWQNVCALGIGADATWAGMGEAWGCVVGVLAVRTAGSGVSRVGAMDED